MMIEDREVIFFTQGGDYVAPLLSDGADGEGGGSSSGLPAVVGAYKVNPAVGQLSHVLVSILLNLPRTVVTHWCTRVPPVGSSLKLAWGLKGGGQGKPMPC